MSASLKTTVMSVVGFAMGLAGGLACRPSDCGTAETKPVTSVVATEYDYSASSGQVVSARVAMRESFSQWPATPEGRLGAMTSRLERVAKAVSVVAGTHCIPRIGATDTGIRIDEEGVVEVDASVLWRLDEDGLAALVAHEVAHYALGHHAQMERIGKDRELGLAGTAQRERLLEIAADEFAGRIIAKAHYRPESFVSALRRVPGCGGHSANVSQTHSVEQRWVAFQRGYSEAVAAATQAASQNER